MVICKHCFIRSICVLYYSCAWSVGIVFSWEAAVEECELLTHLEIKHVSAKCWGFLLCFHNSNFSEWKGSHLPLVTEWFLLPLRKAGFFSRKTFLAFNILFISLFCLQQGSSSMFCLCTSFSTFLFELLNLAFNNDVVSSTDQGMASQSDPRKVWTQFMVSEEFWLLSGRTKWGTWDEYCLQSQMQPQPFCGCVLGVRLCKDTREYTFSRTNSVIHDCMLAH